MTNEDKLKDKKSKRPSKLILFIIIIFLIIFAESLILYYDYISEEDSPLWSNETSVLEDIMNNNSFINNTLSPYLPSKEINITELKKNSTVIGKNDIGKVSVEGPYGNTSSNIKIAYIIGQHPRESSAHDAIYNSILNCSDNLNYSYYIYKIDVQGETEDFEQSRMNGQLLAQEFVVKDIIDGNYDLAIDIHSSNGGYVQDPYIFAPVNNDTTANQSANNLTNVLDYLIYYEPASYSSPQYSTIPIDEGGVPALVFEMRGNSDCPLEEEAYRFVHAVDNLLLSN